jgi:short chain dehydrogenase
VAGFSGSAGAETVIARLPLVDLPVNNVGIFEPKPFAEIPDADWYRLFETNVMSGVGLSRHYLVGMLKRNWGRILSTKTPLDTTRTCGELGKGRWLAPKYPTSESMTSAQPMRRD